MGTSYQIERDSVHEQPEHADPECAAAVFPAGRSVHERDSAQRSEQALAAAAPEEGADQGSELLVPRPRRQRRKGCACLEGRAVLQPGHGRTVRTADSAGAGKRSSDQHQPDH